MGHRVFIDGQAGTTGLRIAERLSERPDIDLIEIDESHRKDVAARLACMAKADVTILCLPDEGAREIVHAADAAAKGGVLDARLAEARIIDCSTAHRTAEGWAYGLPEVVAVDEESMRIANPGCHATGFILAVRPLVENGILDPQALLAFHSLTGYSGGGKTMIAEYEGRRDRVLSECGLPRSASDRASLAMTCGDALRAPRQYGLSQEHKHLPEMARYAGLNNAPVFAPIVGDFYSGMLVSVPVIQNIMQKRVSKKAVREGLAAYYEGCPLIRVREIGDEFSEASGAGFLSAETFSGRDDLEIFVMGNDDRMVIAARYDNLGKGASGAAIQNMNKMLGIAETMGLTLS